MLRSRRGAAVLILAMLGCATLISAPIASATYAPPQNPTRNAPLPSPSSCRPPNNPLSRGCTAALLLALDTARKNLNGSTYTPTLPKRFVYMNGTDQLLLLTNSDRSFYGLPRVFGFNGTLNSSAKTGVTNSTDPPLRMTVSGNSARYATSNWAEGSGSMQNPLGAYFIWMYADAAPYNSGCTSSTPERCWDHRDSMLHNYGSGVQIFMGAAGGPTPGRTGAYTWTDIFEGFGSSNTVPAVATVTTMSTYSVAAPGGQTFTVHAYGLRKVVHVYVCGVSAKFTVTSSTSLNVVAPLRSAGVVGNVTIYTSGGTSNTNGASAFHYT